MSIVMIVLLLACCVNVRFAGENQFHQDYLSPQKTGAVKGVFVILVIFRHFTGYITLDGPYDQIFLWVNQQLGQLLVTLFLFYSGYGIMESIKKKGKSYVRSIPVRRVLKTLLHFDLAIVLFLIMNWVLGRTVTLKSFLLSLVCWNSIGNSDWYVLVILLCYLVTFAAFYFVGNRHYLGAALTTVFCVLIIWVLSLYKDSYFYNTLLCYPLGIWFSLLRKPTEKLVMKNDLCWIGTVTVLLAAYCFAYLHRGQGLAYYSLWAILFALLVLCLTMKVSLDNPFLQFLNDHMFSIYILQRLPMWYLARNFNCDSHPIFYFLLSFLLTILLALAFDWFTGKLDARLFGKRSHADGNTAVSVKGAE